LKQDDLPVSEFLPFQRNSTLPSEVLHWMQNVDLRTTPLPLVIMQYCLTAYIQKQVNKDKPYDNSRIYTMIIYICFISNRTGRLYWSEYVVKVDE
jgi:hypothetical protein